MKTDRANLKKRLSSVLDLPNLVEFFEKNAKHKPFSVKKGSLLSNEGQPLERIFLIKEGFVKLYSLSEEGRETTIYLLGPGYVLGARAFLSKDDCAIHNAEALTDLKVIAISHEEYLDLISENPEYLVDLLQIFINRLIYTEQKLAGFVVGNTTERIANFLLDIYNRFYEGESKEKIILPLPLTHQRIAEFVGAFRETVTTSINHLEKEGVIEFEGHKVVIKDLTQLQKYS